MTTFVEINDEGGAIRAGERLTDLANQFTAAEAPPDSASIEWGDDEFGEYMRNEYNKMVDGPETSGPLPEQCVEMQSRVAERYRTLGEGVVKAINEASLQELVNYAEFKDEEVGQIVAVSTSSGGSGGTGSGGTGSGGAAAGDGERVQHPETATVSGTITATVTDAGPEGEDQPAAENQPASKSQPADEDGGERESRTSTPLLHARAAESEAADTRAGTAGAERPTSMTDRAFFHARLSPADWVSPASGVVGVEQDSPADTKGSPVDSNGEHTATQGGDSATGATSEDQVAPDEDPTTSQDQVAPDEDPTASEDPADDRETPYISRRKAIVEDDQAHDVR